LLRTAPAQNQVTDGSNQGSRTQTDASDLVGFNVVVVTTAATPVSKQ
jgi:hypothetical protein